MRAASQFFFFLKVRKLTRSPGKAPSTKITLPERAVLVFKVADAAGVHVEGFDVDLGVWHSESARGRAAGRAGG